MNKNIYKFIAAGVIILLVLSFSVPATIRFKEPTGSSLGWWGSDTNIIKVSDGRSYTVTPANLQTAIWGLNTTGGKVWIQTAADITLTQTIEMIDDVTLDLGGCTLTASGLSDHMIKTVGNNSKVCNGVLIGDGVGDPTAAISSYNRQNVTIEDIEITLTNGTGIALRGKNCTIRDCRIYDIADPTGSGDTSRGITITSSDGFNSSDNLIIGCIIENVSGNGISMTNGNAGTYNQYRTKIIGNNIRDTGLSGVQLYYNCYWCVVDGNIITDSERRAISVDGSSNNVISDNVIHATTSGSERRGIYVATGYNMTSNNNTITGNTIVSTLRGGIRIDGSNGVYASIKCDGNIVSNNYVGPTNGASDFPNIWIYDCSNTLVSGNVVNQSRSHGISLVNVTQSLITDNIVRETAFSSYRPANAIFMDNSDNNSVMNNFVFDPDLDLDYGINVTSDCENNVFSGNRVIGCTVDGFNLNDAENTLLTNIWNTTVVKHELGYPADYIIYKDSDDVVYCVGGDNGTILSSSATDDVPIQWAIDHLPLSGSELVYGSAETDNYGQEGGLIFIKSGFYNITSTLDLSDIEAVTLQGAGASTVLNNTQTGGQACISATSASWYHRIAIKDMLVQGNTNSGDGLYLRRINYPYITGCTFQRHGDDGAHIVGDGGGTENQVISDCHFLFNDNAGLHLVDTHDNMITNCHFEENDVYGLLADGCSDLHISNSNFEDGYGTHEINITNGRHFIIDNIVVEGNVTVDINTASTYYHQWGNCYVGGTLDVTGDDDRFFASSCQFGVSNISCGGDIKISGTGLVSLEIADSYDVRFSGSKVNTLDVSNANDLKCDGGNFDEVLLSHGQDASFTGCRMVYLNVTSADDIRITNCELIYPDIDVADIVHIDNTEMKHSYITSNKLFLSNSYFFLKTFDIDEYILIENCKFNVTAVGDEVKFDEKCTVSNCDIIGNSVEVAFNYDGSSGMMIFNNNQVHLGSGANQGILINGSGQALPRLTYSGNNHRTTIINISEIDVITVSANTFTGGGTDVYFYDCDDHIVITGNTFNDGGGNAEPIFDATCSGLCVISGNILEDGYTDNTGGAVTFTVTGNAP